MFEFDDIDDIDDTPEQMLPLNGAVFIDVVDGRAIVTRCRYISDDIWTWDRSTNWPDLEEDAMMALTNRYGSVVTGEMLLCPPDITARAVWSSTLEVAA